MIHATITMIAGGGSGGNFAPVDYLVVAGGGGSGGALTQRVAGNRWSNLSNYNWWWWSWRIQQYLFLHPTVMLDQVH